MIFCFKTLDRVIKLRIPKSILQNFSSLNSIAFHLIGVAMCRDSEVGTLSQVFGTKKIIKTAPFLVE